uniref:Transmembrane protein 186 n=1 Tax=Trichuris muris TaxID=70415 RepID=A0A5S6QH61_TRIMR
MLSWVVPRFARLLLHMFWRHLFLLCRYSSFRLGQRSPVIKLPAAHVGSSFVANGHSWQPIYRFKWIALASAVSRLKLVQTAFTTLLVPVAAVAFQNGAISLIDLSCVVSVALFALIMLYVMSYGLRRIIGVVSVDSVASVIRIGYLDFWGRRRNVIVPIDDVVPLSDANVAPNDFWAPVRRYSDTTFLLYLPLRQIEIVDMHKFCSVFGQMQ